MSWIMTYTGEKFDVFSPKKEQIHLIDIAHSLANQCRFNGHCKQFYSIAEHSVYVSYFADAEGLMHDAAEAYIGDITRPIKQFIRIKTFLLEQIERNILEKVFEKFRLQWPVSEDVWEYDTRLCLTEGNLLGFDTSEWEMSHVKPLCINFLPCYDPEKAKELFLARAQNLGIGQD